MKLWSDKSPGETSEISKEKTSPKPGHIEVTNIVKPPLLVYRPDKEKNTGTSLNAAMKQFVGTMSNDATVYRAWEIL